MKNTVKMITVLTVVGFLSGLALVFVYQYANPLIVNNRETETKKAIFKIFPAAETYSEKKAGENIVFEVKGKGGKLLGYAFTAQGNGYQGAIKIMAGIEKDLVTLVGIEILDSQETPGLGQEITTDKFESQFAGLKTLPGITYVKNAKPAEPNEILAITGATISSRAVCAILSEKINELRKNLH